MIPYIKKMKPFCAKFPYILQSSLHGNSGKERNVDIHFVSHNTDRLSFSVVKSIAGVVIISTVFLKQFKRFICFILSDFFTLL